MKTVYTINNDAHTLGNLIASELIINNKDASYRVPHPNAIKTQLILHENTTQCDLKRVCNNLTDIFSTLKHELIVQFPEEMYVETKNAEPSIQVSITTATRSIVTDHDIC